MTMVMRVLKNRFPAIVAAADVKTQEAVEGTISRINEGAQRRSRYDTGWMRAGWTSEMTGHHEGQVYNLVHYTIYHEYGTSMMSAQPMLRPSVEEQTERFIDDLKEAWAG